MMAVTVLEFKLMSSAMAELRGKGSRKATVKMEIDVEDLSDSLNSLHKRPKLDSSSQENMDSDTLGEQSSMFNPLNEPSPLGLRLRKSPSLLDLIQMKLSQDHSAAKLSTLGKRNLKGGNSMLSNTDKLKASNFPASVLKIGTWQYKSRYEGDLVAKCYFAKHKLVWEVLDGSLKNKIEIQWSDIVALKANYPDDAPGTLDVVLARPPLFFRETNPQPRKHTLWQTTSDFTGGQATIHRQHFLQCPQGLLGKHFEKLIQCDPRLNCLSQQPEIVLESPYFETRITTTDEKNELSNGFDLKTEDRPVFFGIHDTTSTSGAQSSSINEQEFTNRAPESYCSEISSACSEFKGIGAENSKMLSSWDQIKVPGIHPSMSMSDLVNHIGNCISEKMTSSTNPASSGKQKNDKGILEEITQYLFNDSQFNLASDEQSLMTRVNSLCCLLQKDSSANQLFQSINDDNSIVDLNTEAKTSQINSNSGLASESKRDNSIDGSDCKQPQDMSRKDSFGELLLSLPRIASLPQFLFNLSQDSDNQAR
uniref:TRF2/HOY1 PH-like domain-containing protein n=1 Tax=Cannabis sativa TaxID=3483 RepID=A0A803P0F0_CANSA